MYLKTMLGAMSAATLTLAASGAALETVRSSHSDAPLIKLDPQANLTDVYAFIGTKYDDPGVQVLNVIANVRPFSEPGDGPHYERFDPTARYSLHIADPATGETLVRYDFEFDADKTPYKNDATILSYGLGTAAGPIMTIGDAQQNHTQRYKVKRFDPDKTILIDGVPIGLPNVGANVTPLYNDPDGRALSGAQDINELDAYTAQAIHDATSGIAVFAGPRDDSFYADIPGVFDLLNVRILDNNGSLDDGLGQDGAGVDGFKGFNVLTYAIQIPLDQLPARAYTDAFFGPQTGVGVYASVSRRMFTRRNSGDDVADTGKWVQVNRLGNPVFNEALVALADKDRYNATDPVDDAQFATYAENPEIAGLINLVYNTSFETTARHDLVSIFIPDVLRVATTTGPVPLDGQPGFSRFGFVGGDTTGGVSSGWPNGRRPGDDVVDIALTAVASGPTYDNITVVGDNVEANDALFNAVFPYLATPHSGTFNRKDSPSEFERVDLTDDGVIDTADFFEFLALYQANR